MIIINPGKPSSNTCGSLLVTLVGTTLVIPDNKHPHVGGVHGQL